MGRLYSRSDITITGSYDECNISNFDGDSLQVETNTIDAGRLFRPNLTNIIVREGSVNGLDLNVKDATTAGLRAPFT